ncbi:hypothetical protein [Streptomyces sp. TP-A0874]|uniref:hypothetical protein n=1 Tax=Streptomyces sp. TP-A0874 TaxID=549819 RepID=UPI00148066F3|nr:hypothetical protein [Streptomyces sp. TP-A0874]
MAGAAKTMAGCTVVGLIFVTAYTVALGTSAWLWLTWSVLCLMTLGLAVTRRTGG